MATNQDKFDALPRLLGSQLGVLRTMQALSEKMVSLLSRLKSVGSGFGTGGGENKKKDKEPSLFEKLGGAFKKFNKVLGVVGLIVGAITAAVLAIPLAIAGIVKTSESFVKAIDPSSVERYQMAQEDLKATIGSGLTPIIAYATKTVKEWAGELLPIMQKFKPIVDRFSNAVSGATSSAFRAFAQWLDNVVNRLTKMAPAIESMINTVGVFVDLFAAVVEAVEDILDPSEVYTKLLDAQARVLRELAVATAHLTARFLQLVGASESLQKFRKSLEKAREARLNPKEGLKAVPKDITTSGVQDIARVLNERAFAATGGVNTKKSDTELLDDILSEVKAVQMDPKTLEQIISDAFYKAVTRVQDAVPDPVNVLVTGKGVSTGNWAADAITSSAISSLNPLSNLFRSK